MLKRIGSVKLGKEKSKKASVALIVIAFVIGLAIGYFTYGAINTAPQFEAGENLLQNSGFESEIDEEPAYWFKAWIPADNLTMPWDDTVVHNGSRSASISNAHDYEEDVCNNWAQIINQIPTDRIVELSGWVKTVDAESVVMVIQCWDKNNNMVGFGTTQTTTEINGTTDWEQYTASVRVPNDTESIIVRLVLTGKGQVWFDDVTLVVK